MGARLNAPLQDPNAPQRAVSGMMTRFDRRGRPLVAPSGDTSKGIANPRHAPDPNSRGLSPRSKSMTPSPICPPTPPAASRTSARERHRGELDALEAARNTAVEGLRAKDRTQKPQPSVSRQRLLKPPGAVSVTPEPLSMPCYPTTTILPTPNTVAPSLSPYPPPPTAAPQPAPSVPVQDPAQRITALATGERTSRRGPRPACGPLSRGKRSTSGTGCFTLDAACARSTPRWPSCAIYGD